MRVKNQICFFDARIIPAFFGGQGRMAWCLIVV